MPAKYSALIDWHLNLDNILSDTIDGFEVLDENLWVGNKRLELLSNPTKYRSFIDEFPGIFYAHLNDEFSIYEGSTCDDFRYRFNEKKGKGYIEVDGEVPPLLLMLVPHPLAFERTIQHALENRGIHLTKNGSITFGDDLIELGYMPDIRHDMDAQMEEFFEEFMFPINFNYEILKQGNLCGCLTKQQAIDWATRNYAKEDEEFFYLHHYKSFLKNDVVWADTHLHTDDYESEEGLYLKLHKSLEHVPREQRTASNRANILDFDINWYETSNETRH